MNLYGLGSNGSGQLGLGHQHDVSRPERCQVCKDRSRLVKITASSNTTFLLFDDGRICCAGVKLAPVTTSSPHDDISVNMFREVAFTKDHIAKLCSASWEALIIVTETDDIYVCGRGMKGELGLGPELTATDDHAKLGSFLPKGTTIVDINSSVSHTVAVLSNGEAYGWGNGRKGQLGEFAEVVWIPRKFGSLKFKVSRVVCGREFTLLAGDPSVGQVTIFGVDKWDLRSQVSKQFPDWKDIGAGWGSIFVLDRKGSMCSWGRNDCGQLAPMDLPPIARMSIGSEHTVALTESGNVICWGWGEHGNCGNSAAKVKDTACPWNEIEVPDSSNLARVHGIGTGCATSFFWTGAENN